MGLQRQWVSEEEEDEERQRAEWNTGLYTESAVQALKSVNWADQL